MVFEDIVAILERTFKTELSVVQDTTAFEVTSEDSGTKIRVFVQDESEHNLVLLFADLGPLPPDGCEKLFRTMLEANNLFAGTAGATLSLDAATEHFRLQWVLPPDVFGNDVEGKLTVFIETALNWSRTLADFRPSAEGGASDDVFARMMQV